MSITLTNPSTTDISVNLEPQVMVPFEHWSMNWNSTETGPNATWDGYQADTPDILIPIHIDGDSNYYNFSINSQINDLTTIEFSLLYGNFNKDKSGTMNSWGVLNEDFFGIILNFDFKISEKIEAGFPVSI